MEDKILEEDVLEKDLPELLEEDMSSDTDKPLDKNIKLMSPGRMVVRRFLRSKLSIAGLVMLIALFTFCWLGPVFYNKWHEDVPDRTGEIEQIIKKDDPNFTSDDFTSFAKEVYMDIQTAWCKRDLTSVRPVMHNNLYNTTQKQVQSKIDQKVIYHYESITINTAYLTSYVRDEQFEYLTVYLNARFIDYQTNEETGAVIRGDKNTRWDFRYKMKFMRTVGVKTKEASGSDHGHNCPNCGAPLEMSSSGQCAYCGSVVTSGLYSWVLSDFTTVRDDTKDDGIRVNQDNNGDEN